MRSIQLLAVACFPLALVACGRDSETAKLAYVKSGDQYAEKGDLAAAAIQYKNAIKVDPRYGEARYKLGGTLARSGDGGGAYSEYVRAADLMPKDIQAQISAGNMGLAAGQFEEARARADRALALSPTNPDALMLRGNALAGLKDFNAAAAQVQAAIEADPERALAYADLGAIETARGNREKAEQAFQAAVRVSKSAGAYAALANFYWASGKRDLARQALESAIAIEPKNVGLNQSLAYLYVMLGRNSEAEAPLKLVADETKDPSSRLLLAEYYRQTGRQELALQILDGLGADKKTFAVARARKSALLHAAGRKPEAYAAVDEVLVKDPKNSVALLARADLLSSDRDLDGALKSAEAAAAADPKSVSIQFVIGRIQAARGEFGAATAAFNNALKLAPTFVPAQIELSRVSLLDKRPKDAVRFAEEALAMQPGNADATLLKATALLAQGDVAAAEPSMKLLTANFPDSPLVQSQLGTLYRLKKDFTAARTAYERAIKIDSGNLEALAGLTALDLFEKKASTARARVDAALTQHPESGPLLVLASQTYMTLGDDKAAERVLRKAVEQQPPSFEAYLLLGQLFDRERRLDEAITEFNELAKRKPSKSVTAHTFVGILLEKKNRRQEAAQRYEQALGIDKSAPIPANNLAMYYLDTGGNLDVALRLAQVAKAGLPDDPLISDTLGWAYYKKGLASLAIPPFRESLAKDPNRPEYLAHLGLAYANAGQTENAKDALKRALAHGQDFHSGKEASETLAALTR